MSKAINHRNVKFSTICRSTVTRLPGNRTFTGHSPLQKAILDTFGSDVAISVPVPDRFINMPRGTAKFADAMRSCIYSLAREKGYAAHGILSADGRNIQMWVDTRHRSGSKIASLNELSELNKFNG